MEDYSLETNESVASEVINSFVVLRQVIANRVGPNQVLITNVVLTDGPRPSLCPSYIAYCSTVGYSVDAQTRYIRLIKNLLF